MKIHQLLYVNLPKEKYQTLEILAVSTEDGRILLYSTRSIAGEKPNSETRSDIPTLQAFGEIGGVNESLVGRIKDFEIINAVLPGNPDRSLIVIAGSSDGAIRVWSVEIDQLMTSLQAFEGNIDLHERETVANGTSMRLTHQLGQLLGTYKTGNRITCLKAFLMHDPKDADDGEKPSDENNHMRSTLDENSRDSPI